jgi:poly-gamma-glutamate synthesis protein (capsule biosynthesis protein)
MWRASIRTRAPAASLCAAAALLLAAPLAAAQMPAPPAPALKLAGPALRAAGIDIPLTGSGAAPGALIELQRLVDGERWVTIKTKQAGPDGTVKLAYDPGKLSSRYVLRLAAGGIASPPIAVRTREITLAAFGDANFGDGVAAVMDVRGALWPWRGVAPTLRAADIAFGNLECAISTRGFPVPKQFNFRGRPDRLRQVVRFAGLDVLNLANNHAGDYGRDALLDTVRAVRSSGAVPVGAGATLTAARRPQVVSRLGLRVGFVGFSDIGPASFAAGPGRPGTSFASRQAIAEGVRAAARRSDVVVATFHWGIERSTSENARQREFARVALAAGATAVIAAHPHVLQPIRRAGKGRRKLVAYSLGNFVWAAGSGLTSATGILRVKLSGRGVEGAKLLRARIEGTRPRLLR